MIDTAAHQDDELRAAVNRAASGLIGVNHWSGFSFLSLPLIAPDGSNVAVRIRRKGGRFLVDDGGFVQQDLFHIGADRSFPRTASKLLEDSYLEVADGIIGAEVEPNELERAICDVAISSWQVLDRIYAKQSLENEDVGTDYLQNRLAHIFGESRVAAAEKVTGASTEEWPVSAVVHINDRVAVFQAVGEQANSIFRASAVLRDIADLDNPPIRVAVVKDKEKLGRRLGLLSRSSRVIQGDQEDEVYRRAIA